jgi:peroxidase
LNLKFLAKLKEIKIISSKRKPLSTFLYGSIIFHFILQLGGPFWNVKVGRRDSRTANFTAANTGVIPPPTSNLNNLISTFKAQGLSAKDMVALSGILFYFLISHFFLSSII